MYLATLTQLWVYTPYSLSTGAVAPTLRVSSLGTQLKLTQNSVVTAFDQNDILPTGTRGVTYVYDTSTLSVARTITAPGIMPGPTLAYSNGEIYTNVGSEVYAIDDPTGAANPAFNTAQSPGCGVGTCTGGPVAGAIGPGGLLYTLDSTDDLVDIYNPNNGALSSFSIMSGSGVVGPITVGPDGDIYLADTAGGALVYSSTGTLLATLLPTTDEPDTGKGGAEVMTLDPNGYLWVYNPAAGLQIYNTADIDAAPAPEPANIMLCGLGILAALSRQVARRKPSRRTIVGGTI